MTTTSTSSNQQDVRLAIVLVTAHEHLRFETSVPAATTVLGLKELLYKTLAGRPHPSGQSLMHLGRTLENSEVLGRFLNVPKIDVHTLYITLQAHAWTERPPQGAQTAQAATSHATAPHPHQLMTPGDIRARVDPRNERAPLSYIHWMHYNALRALLGYPAYTIPNPAGRLMEVHKQDALNFYSWSNVKWPPAFEREQELYSTPREVGEGIPYADYDGSLKPMMKLHVSSKPPTPLQKLALEIMAYTFPLLSVEISPAQLESVNPRNRYRKAKIDAYMQAVHHAWANNLPMPPPPATEDRLPAPVANRQVIVRIGVDSVLLILRASMVYWFLRPFSRTITGIAFVGWILYEIYQLWARPHAGPPNAAAAGQGQRPAAGGRAGAVAPAAGAGGAAAGAGAVGTPQNNNNDNQNNAGGNAGAVAVAGANGVAGGNPAAAAAVVNPGNNNNNAAAAAAAVAPAADVPGGGPRNLRNFWQRCARVGLEAEARASIGVRHLDGGRVHAKLGWRHRVLMFVIMLVLTIHPQYWTERQQLLRERERDLRVLYGVLREEDGEEEEEEEKPQRAANGAGSQEDANGNIQEKTEQPVAPPKPQRPGGFVGQYVHRARRGLL